MDAQGILNLISTSGLALVLVVLFIIYGTKAAKKIYADFRSDQEKKQEEDKEFTDRIITCQERITDTMDSIDKRLTIVEQDVADIKKGNKNE